MLFFRLEETEQVLHRDADARDSDPAAEAHENRLAAGLDQLYDIGIHADSRHRHNDKELDSVLSGVNTPAGTPTVAHTVVMMDASTKYRINIGNARLSEKASPPRLCSVLALWVRHSASTSVIGMIASVRVSLTMVAISSVLLPWMPSHAEAAAVTDEVSFTAVPANRPKPWSVMPSMPPSVGKVSAAMTLNRKITEIACAISSSSAPMTGAVAAIAEPPQMDEPTPTSVEMLDGTFIALHSTNDTISEVLMVETMIGSDCAPTFAISGQVKTEAEQDNRVLQHLFRCKTDARLHLGLVLPEQREHHADQDGEYRSADNRHRLSQQPRRNRNAQAQQQSGTVFLDKIHCFTPLLNRILVYTIPASQFNTQFVQRAKEISLQALCRLIGTV